MNKKVIIDLKEYRRSLATDIDWVRIQIQEATTPNVRAYWSGVIQKWIIVDHALETVIKAAVWIDLLKKLRAEESNDKRGDTSPSLTK